MTYLIKYLRDNKSVYTIVYGNDIFSALKAFKIEINITDDEIISINQI